LVKKLKKRDAGIKKKKGEKDHGGLLYTVTALGKPLNSGNKLAQGPVNGQGGLRWFGRADRKPAPDRPRAAPKGDRPDRRETRKKTVPGSRQNGKSGE